MSKDLKNPQIRISITHIKEISFFIMENLIATEDQAKEILVDFMGQTGFHSEKNLFNFTLKAWYHYKEDETKIAAIEVANIFFIENIKNFIDDKNEINFPASLWVTIVGLSISHTRALFSKSLSGTVLQNVIINITDPVKIAQQFFPKSFEGEATVANKD